MENKVKDIIRIIGWIVLITIIIVIAYQIIKAVIGGTWETENIIVGALGITLSGLFIIVGFLISQSRVIGRIDERTKILGESLSNLGRDFKEHIKSHKYTNRLK